MKKNSLPLNETQMVKILKKTDKMYVEMHNDFLYIIAEYIALKINNVVLQNYPKLQTYIRSIFGNIKEREVFKYNKQDKVQPSTSVYKNFFSEDIAKYVHEYSFTKLYYQAKNTFLFSDKLCIFETTSEEEKNKYTFINLDLIESCNILQDDTLRIKGYNNNTSPVYIQPENDEFTFVMMPAKVPNEIKFLK